MSKEIGDSVHLWASVWMPLLWESFLILCLSNIYCILFCAHCLFFCHWTPVRNQFLFPLFLPIRYLVSWIRSSQAFSSLGYTVPDLPAPPPCMKGALVPCCASLAFLQYCLCLSYMGEPRTDPSTQYGWVEKDPLPPPAGSAFPNATQETVGLLCCKCTSVPHDQLGVHQSPSVLHFRVAFQVISSQPVLMISIRPLQLQDSHFPLLNFLRYLLASCSTLTKVPLNESTPIWCPPPSWASSANLLRVGSVLLSRSLWRC